MNTFLAIFIAGGLGAASRYAVYDACRRPSLEHFPYATLVVNVLGCLLIGLVGAALFAKMPEREVLRDAVLIGFLGGFTTFSAFSADVLRLVHTGEHGKALAHIAMHFALCLGAVWVGHLLGVSIWGKGQSA